jgi:WD40 repeat protein
VTHQLADEATVSRTGQDRCPYVGLRAYSFNDRALFFGREEQVKTLEPLVECNRFVAVVGSSGSGKSSLIRAGLLPSLASSVSPTWIWAEMRPSARPLRRLADAIATVEIGSRTDAIQQVEARADRIEILLRSSTYGLSEALSTVSVPDNKRILILVDQFEEVFRFSDLRRRREIGALAHDECRDEATHFVQLLLAAAADDDLPIHIIITMRSDFIGDCARFHLLPEAVTLSQYLVPGLTRDQRLDAIREPLRTTGGSINPELVQRLINDLSDDPDELPVLQHVLMRCWHKAALNNPSHVYITEEDYEKIGTTTNALSVHADELLSSLTERYAFCDERYDVAFLTKRLFQCLTDTDRQFRVIRRPQTFGDIKRAILPESYSGDAQVLLRRAIERFSAKDCSFLRASANLTDDSAIDIGHEALIRQWDKLSAETGNWVREEFEDGEQYRDLVREVRGIIPSDQLPAVDDWWFSRQPTRFWASRHTIDGRDRFDEVLALLAHSRQEADFEARKREAEAKERQRYQLMRARYRKAAVVFSFVLIVLVSIALGVLQRNIVLQQEATIKDQKEQANFANLQAQIQQGAIDYANQYAKQVLASRYKTLSLLSEDALRRDGPTRALLFAAEGLKNAVPEADTTSLQELSYRALQELREFRRFAFPKRQAVAAVAISPDGKKVVMADREGLLRKIDVSSGELEWEVQTDIPAAGLTWSLDGQTILVGSFVGPAARVDANSGKSYRIGAPGELIGLGYFAPSSDYFVTGHFNSPPTLWRSRDGQKLKSFDFVGETIATAISGDGKVLAAGSRQGELSLLDPMTGERLKRWPLQGRFSGRPVAVFFLTFDPSNAKRLLVMSDGATTIWNTDKIDDQPTRLQYPAGFNKPAFSFDGEIIAAGSVDGLIRIWRNEEDLKAQPFTILRGHSQLINGVAFGASSGTILGSASEDGSVRLWNLVAALRPVEVNWNSATADLSAGVSIQRMPPKGVLVRIERDGRTEEISLPNSTEVASAAYAGNVGRLAIAPKRGRIVVYNTGGPTSPFASFGDANTTWTRVNLDSEARFVFAEDASGRTLQWQIFADPTELVDFIFRNLPTDGRSAISLTNDEACMLEVNQNASCEK